MHHYIIISYYLNLCLYFHLLSILKYAESIHQFYRHCADRVRHVVTYAYMMRNDVTQLVTGDTDLLCRTLDVSTIFTVWAEPDFQGQISKIPVAETVLDPLFLAPTPEAKRTNEK